MDIGDEAFNLVLMDLLKLLRQGKTLFEAETVLRKAFMADKVDRVIQYWQDRIALNSEADGLTIVKGLGAADAWYPGTQEGDVHWPSLRDYLLDNPKRSWSQSEVDELDRQSTRVLASCRSPWIEKSSGRGLVVGYVQSGKTTNFTAVMAKAADAGFRLFIVLSGTTKSLRRQTQQRLEEQLRQLNDHLWYFHTELPDKDVGTSTNWTQFLHERHAFTRTCIVVKKNKRRLKNLIKALDHAQEKGYIDRCPIMVIDDEGDQASLSPYCDRKRATEINKLIVDVLDRPRLSYIAYTATPFANFFVDAKYPDNLYPRDFILALPESPGYIGASKMFGADGEPTILSVIDVPESEANTYVLPPPMDTGSLRNAVQWFLMAATVRRLRNAGKQPHTTMLVNVSERTIFHAAYWRVVRDIVVGLRTAIVGNDPEVRRRMADQWSDETILVDPNDFGYAPTSFDEIWESLEETIDLLGPLDGADHDSNPDCAIVVDNSVAAYRLAYDDNAPRPVIVVGGNTLSRGLTLEGLVSTFFLRSSKLYDTLLQMGRWFGFRPGYEDLYRVWMPAETREKFEFLAGVESHLRYWIDVYARTGKTPLELGPRIMWHPSMQITRAAMLKNYKLKFSLSGTHAETSIFENSPAATVRNRSLMVELATALLATSDGEQLANGHLFRDVDVSIIERFFREGGGYEVIGHSHLDSTALRKYIALKKKHGELESWNVVIRKKRGGGNVVFLPGIDASLVSRSRKSESGGNLDIGSLADSGDDTLDIPADWTSDTASYRRDHPLLVIYLIDKDSKPDARGLKRGNTDLAAIDHLVGFNLFLPFSSHVDEDDIKVVIPDGPWNAIEDEEDDEPDPEFDDEQDAEDRE
jgi:hypothetical protein